MADERAGSAMDTPLSDAGRARKAALRSQLLHELQLRRRWRLGLQGALAAIALATCAWAVVDGVRSLPAVAPGRASSAGVPADTVALTIVRDDPFVVQRLSAVAGPPLVEVLRDETLLAMLHTTGRQAGVARLGDQFVVAGFVPDPWR